MYIGRAGLQGLQPVLAAVLWRVRGLLLVGTAGPCGVLRRPVCRQRSVDPVRRVQGWGQGVRFQDRPPVVSRARRGGRLLLPRLALVAETRL
jgi:hypothetical protein